MVVVRRCHKGEMEKIIEVANASFVPVRYEGFDFKERMPKIYAANKDYSDMHFCVEADGKMTSVAGNLIKTLNLNNKEYPYSIIGTVSTLLEESNKGYMALLMKEMDKENINKNVVFSMLTGKRQRYFRYGFERGGSRIIYEVNTHYFKHVSVEGEILVRPFEEKDLDKIFSIYLENQPIIVRKKEEFILDLRISNSTVYTLIDQDEIIGYFAIGDSVQSIHEISLNDLSKIPVVIKSILKYLNKEQLEVIVNPLNVSLMQHIDIIAEGKLICEEIMWNVYKMIPFIEMCLELNKGIKNYQDATEIYKVDDQIIKISTSLNSFKVEEVHEEYSREFTKLEFIKFIIGNTSHINKASKIFPLELDFNEGDMF